MSAKRLYRTYEDRRIAGVCSGLGTYFNIDPVIFRALFLIGVFIGTGAIWVYLILWLIVPSRKFDRSKKNKNGGKVMNGEEV